MTIAGILRAKRRQTASYANESGDRKANPPPWKKIITGRQDDNVVLGMKIRYHRFRLRSTVKSEVLTPLTGLGLGRILRSTKFAIRRLRVPFLWRTVSLKAERKAMEMRVFHGSTGFRVSDELVAAIVFVT